MIKLAVIIPAYNEDTTLKRVIKNIPSNIEGIDRVITIVVDDGSSDKTKETAKAVSDFVLSHPVNMGTGAATVTGLEFAKMTGCQYAITLDADGQHNPQDIKTLIQPLLDQHADIVSGARVKERLKMPLFKRLGNQIMNILTFIIFGKWVNDSQSGMRAFNQKSLLKMDLSSIGYEVCSEIVGEAKIKNLRFLEIPIDTIYSKYSKKKGQNMFNAVNIFTSLINIKHSKKR